MSEDRSLLVSEYQWCLDEFADMVERPVVLAVQDTSFLNFTHHPETEGLGAVGNKGQKQRGFGMHSTLAVTPKGLPLG